MAGRGGNWTALGPPRVLLRLETAEREPRARAVQRQRRHMMCHTWLGQQPPAAVTARFSRSLWEAYWPENVPPS
jgi:hypothetical protein